MHYFLTTYIFKTVLIIKTKYILQILVTTHNSKIHIYALQASVQ